MHELCELLHMFVDSEYKTTNPALVKVNQHSDEVNGFKRKSQQEIFNSVLTRNLNISEPFLCAPYLQENKTGKLPASFLKSHNINKPLSGSIFSENKQAYYLKGLAETTRARLETIS